MGAYERGREEDERMKIRGKEGTLVIKKQKKIQPKFGVPLEKHVLWELSFYFDNINSFCPFFKHQKLRGYFENFLIIFYISHFAPSFSQSFSWFSTLSDSKASTMATWSFRNPMPESVQNLQRDLWRLLVHLPIVISLFFLLFLLKFFFQFYFFFLFFNVSFIFIFYFLSCSLLNLC